MKQSDFYQATEIKLCVLDITYLGMGNHKQESDTFRKKQANAIWTSLLKQRLLTESLVLEVKFAIFE